MRQRRVLIAVLAVVVVAGGVAFLVNRSSSGGDIFLEGAGDTGANPFTTIAARQCADGFQVDADGRCVPTSTSSALPGDTTTTALYGGSGSQKRCDPEALIAFLTTHSDKATAWVQGLNEDPSLSWSGGNKVSVADIPAFIRELTPTFLTQDTRVTNHGYFNGKATPHQSVLQKGTAVLVDHNGIPRSRCACGNPLGKPHKVRNPHYKGHCWDGCHSQPFCAPPGCTGTTSILPTTSTTCVPGKGQTTESTREQLRTSGTTAATSPPNTQTTEETLVVRTTLPPCTTTSSSTTTTLKRTVRTTTTTVRGTQPTQPTTTTTQPTTSTTQPTTSTTQPTTSTSCSPNNLRC